MNTRLAIMGCVGGALSAAALSFGLPWFDTAVALNRCDSNSAAATMSRSLSWEGGDSLNIRVPGSVHFKVGQTWSAIATGPSDVVSHVQIRAGQLEFDQSMDICTDALRIELTGPAVEHWALSGSGKLVLADLQQPKLDISVAGSGSVSASGVVEHTQAEIKGSGDLLLDGLTQSDLDLTIKGSGSATANGTVEHAEIMISGSGDAKFSKLIAKLACVQINGSGGVSLSSADTMDVQINGSGRVHVSTKPRDLQSRIHGSGRVMFSNL